MALINCPECGREISDYADTCPHCGHPLGLRRNNPSSNETYITPNGEIPGKGQATASLVLGIVSVVFWFFGVTAFISVVLGIIGCALAVSAKNKGFENGTRTAGYVLSLIGVIGGVIAVIALIVLASFATTLLSYWS